MESYGSAFDPMNWFKAINHAVPSLTLQEGERVLTEVVSINNFFTDCQLPLTILQYPLTVSAELHALIRSDVLLNESESDEVMQAILPSKSEALSLLEQVDLIPAVAADYWSMQSTNVLNQCDYPRLNQSSTLQQEKIVTDLDRFHRNMTLEGVPSDEFIYMLNGSVHFYFFTARGVVHLDVTAADGAGWLLVYKGSIPHGGVFSPNTKQLALIAGPREWQMQFYSLDELQSETQYRG